MDKNYKFRVGYITDGKSYDIMEINEDVFVIR